MVMKTSDERRLLQLQSRELTIRSKRADLDDAHVKVKEEIALHKSKMSKGRK
jgi:hypothetical protein